MFTKTRSSGESSLESIVRLWFDFSRPVSRRAYILSGLGLGLLKVGVDNTLMILWFGHGRLADAGLLPYVGPSRDFFTTIVQQGLHGWELVLILWTLPFLWIGASMTARRAADAGGSPWLGALFFVPFVSYALMLLLCVLPTREEPTWDLQAARPPPKRSLWAWGLIVMFATGVGFGLALIHSRFMQTYGLALFFGVPFFTGALAGYLANRDGLRSIGSTVLAAVFAQLVVGAGLLVAAVEGVVCLLMALPFAIAVAAVGAIWARECARRRPEQPVLTGCLLVLLPTANLLAPAAAPVSSVVTSQIEIAAPPEVVWRHVVSFSELPPPREWLFHTGVAYPTRARISGHGVGAVRHCEFSTGPFVEPITVWDEPRRLAFDVTASPIPMEEWSPYRNLYAAHLHSGFRSRRGEFRLVALPGGRTRLEGRTWYLLDIHPFWYWHLYADAIVHTIHARVLRHIQTLAEAEAQRLAARPEVESRPRLDPVRPVP